MLFGNSWDLGRRFLQMSWVSIWGLGLALSLDEELGSGDFEKF